MGYPMAVNLRTKIDPSYKILICDISKDVISRYEEECKGKGSLAVVQNGYEAVQAAVCNITMNDSRAPLTPTTGCGYYNASGELSSQGSLS